VAKPGVSKWGVKGEGTGGVYPIPLGVRGLCPRKIFKLQMHVGEFWRAFQTKISALTPVFMSVDFDKVSNPFDF
jgi:hypothetical protein